MAIKFVDIKPEGDRSKKAAAPKTEHQAKAAVDENGLEPAPEPNPELPFSKSEPKQRGREKPLKLSARVAPLPHLRQRLHDRGNVAP